MTGRLSSVTTIKKLFDDKKGLNLGGTTMLSSLADEGFFYVQVWESTWEYQKHYHIFRNEQK